MSLSYKTFINAISDHMGDQPYQCKCAECGTNLETSAIIDVDLYLILDVHPCKTCIEQAVADARDD